MSTNKPKLTVETLDGLERRTRLAPVNVEYDTKLILALCYYARIGLEAEIKNKTTAPCDCYFNIYGEPAARNDPNCPIHKEKP